MSGNPAEKEKASDGKPKKKYASLLPPHGKSHGDEEHGEGNWLVSYADMMTLLVGFFVILLSFSKMDDEKFEEAKKSVTQQFGGVFTIPYEELYKRLVEAVKNLGLGEQLVIKQSDVGISLSLRGTVFFDTGKADLKPEAMEPLQKLIDSIKADSVDYDITVEGHTDDVPISSNGFKNNFELSSIRACRVLDFFKEAGFSASHLIAVGYGETRPLVPNRTPDGTAIAYNQNQNRRVIIKIFKHAEPMLESTQAGPKE